MIITDTTQLINTATGAYPVYLPQVRASNITKSFAQSPSEDILATLGYAVVHPTTQPTAQVVRQDAPEMRNGRWEQQWIARDFTPSENRARFVELKEKKLEEIRAFQVAMLERGFRYTFPDNSVGRVQLRDGDRANIGALHSRGKGLKAAGNTEAQWFRTLENEIKGPLSPDQAIVLADVAYEKYMFIMVNCWGLKDLAEKATDAAGLPTVPENFDALGI